MSMMLIDQTKDAACKTAEADAIRAKTGGSSQLVYDWVNNKGFADAIAAIPSGGGESMNVQHFEYVQATNSLTPVSATQGSTLWFANTYFNKGEGLYWAFLTDDTATSAYRGRAAWKANNVGAVARGYCRPENWITTESSDSWFLVKAGAKIDVFFIPKSEF